MRRASVPRDWITDPAWALAALLLLGPALVASHFAAFPHLAVVSLALLPGVLAHVALTFPVAPAWIREHPMALAGPYAACLALSVMALRSIGTQPDVAPAVQSLSGVLAWGACLALVVRVIGASLRAADARFRKPSRVALSGAALSVIAAILQQAGTSSDAAFLIATAALPVALAIAIVRMSRAARSPEPMDSSLLRPGISLEQVARGMAHAMLKPVSSVSDQLGRLAVDEPDPHRRTELRAGAEVMEQVERLVRDVLELSRAQSPLRRRRVSVTRVVAQAVETVTARYPSASVRSEVEECFIIGDEVALRNALVNLLENAIEARHGAGNARVAASSDESAVHLVIEDESGGLPEEVRQRLFEPFVTTKPRGIGLGLPVANEICRAHGGILRVENTELGTRFSISLPLFA